MTALADHPAASGLTLRPLPEPGRSTIGIAPYLPLAGAAEPTRRLTIDLAGVERWQRPAFVQYIEAELNSLLELRAGWDGRRARAITLLATEATVRVLASLMNDTSAPPQLFPLPDGGLQVEWHVGGNSIEVETDASGEPHLLARASDGTMIAEGAIVLGEPDAQLLTTRNFLQGLSQRLAHVLTHA
jgi:hypothetical protein